jgi:hypothetical protein
MEESEYACILESAGICGRIRTEVFRQYCRLEQKEKLLRTCHVVRFPFAEEEDDILARFSPEEMGADAPLMKRISEWLADVCAGKEEENDCIIETDG